MAWRSSVGPLVYMKCDRPRAYMYMGQSHQNFGSGFLIYPFKISDAISTSGF